VSIYVSKSIGNKMTHVGAEKEKKERIGRVVGIYVKRREK
jgi:hypothetical protein